MVIPFWVGFAIQAVVTVLSIADQRKRAKKARQEAAARAEAAKGLTIPTEGESAPVTVYYGRNKMGGNRVYHNTLNSYVYSEPPAGFFQTFDAGFNMHASIAGSKHEFLVFQQTLSFGGIGDVKHILVNDKSFDIAEYSYGSLINYCPGGSAADPLLTANIPERSTAYFTNVSYLTGFFRLNRDDAQFNSVPSVQTLGNGLKVRSIIGSAGARYLSSTKTYSNNPALVLIDYLTNPIYGRGLSDGKLDLDSFYDASVVCDKVILSDAPKDGLYWTNTVEQRVVRLYETNIGLDSSKVIRDNVESILETMAGSELVWSGGIYKLKLLYPEIWVGSKVYNIGDIVQDGVGANVDLYRCVASSTAQPTSHPDWARSVISAYITDDDIIRKGENSIAWPNAQSRLNYVTVRYLNEATEFSEDSVSWPPKSSSVYTAYLSEDFNAPLEADFFENGITDYYHAMAKAEQRCRLSRNAVVYKYTVGANLSGLEPGDVVKVNSTVLGIPGEVMTVDEIKVQPNGNAELQCTKFDAAQLAWNAPDDQIITPRNIYDAIIEQATGLIYNPLNPDQVSSSGLLTWNNASDSRVQSYKIKISTAVVADANTVWTELTTISRQTNSATTKYSLPALDPGDYLITVVACTFNKIADRDNWPVLSITTLPIAEAVPAQTLLRIFKRGATVPATPTGGSFNFSTYLLSTVPSGWSINIPSGLDDVYVSDAVAIDPGSSGIDSTLTWTSPILYLYGDTIGSLTEPIVGVSQSSTGANIYTAAIGKFKLVHGTVDVTGDAGPVFSVVSQDGVVVTISNTIGATKGNYAVTSLTKDKGSALLRAVYQGVTIEITLSVVMVGAAKIRDLTPPPAPTGLTAVSTNTTTYITQTTPTYTVGHGHGYTEVWASASNVVGASAKIDQFSGNNHNMPIPINTARYLWFKWISQDGGISAISAASINVSSATIQTVDINSGAITTTLLANNAVTQGKFSTADINNLIFNPDFSTGDTRSWNRITLTGGGAVDVIPKETSGVPFSSSTNYVLRMFHLGGTETSITSSDGAYDTAGLVGGIPVNSGESFHLYLESAVSTIGGTGLVVDFIQKTAAGAITTLASIPVTQALSWTVTSTDITATATGRLYIRIGQYNGSSKVCYVTNIKLHKRNSSDLIVDGAIIASKVAVDAIAAGNIQADAVTSNKIAAGQIIASKMAVDSITAANGAIADLAVTNAKIGGAIQSNDFVTGSAGWQINKTGSAELNNATFRGTVDVKSSTSGARLEIRNNVIKVFDSTGALRVQIGDLTA